MRVRTHGREPLRASALFSRAAVPAALAIILLMAGLPLRAADAKPGAKAPRPNKVLLMADDQQ